MAFIKIKNKNLNLNGKNIPFVKLFPNIVTLVGLSVGVSSIRFALDGRWESAMYCILVTCVLDWLDGRVARLFNATSHFGAELDSLCDLVNFGVCPAIITYLWSFQKYEYKIMSWASIMLFIICMAIRLARFNTLMLEKNNTDNEKTNNNFFVGVPAPSGALLLLIPIIIDFDFAFYFGNFSMRNHTLYINLYTILIALLLPSRLPTISLKKIKIKPQYVSLSLVIAAALIVFLFIYPWYSLPIIALFYLSSIPYCMYLKNKNK